MDQRLPRTPCPLLIRTDFTDPAAWAALRKALETPDPEDGFVAELELLDDPAYENATPERIVELAPYGEPEDHTYLFVADRTALSAHDHPVLVLDLYEETRGDSVRAIATELHGVEANLSIGNLDFYEYRSSADDDGVFRGF
ncbi:DUF6924 domain-containing protein [Streptomyces chattanoogensis]|uniref:DUF6924 domain-containing protein n=1 Tax=Streptomyces chattanoogensis TaxID=66876 RepID=UPI0036A67AC3